MKLLEDIYYTLLNEYGYQKWWPLKDGKEPFLEISLGAILTQNTSWKNVEKALENLIKENLISFEKLENIPEELLHQIIKPAGFYKRKSKTIKEFVKKTKKIDRKKIDRDFLLSIKGIGKETADSILLYALEKPVFVVDAYTKRIFSRVGILEKNADYDEVQIVFEKNLPKDVNLFKEYHALIVEHGKRFCRKKPLCENCPLKDLCQKNI